jgi:hypothetical protein
MQHWDSVGELPRQGKSGRCHGRRDRCVQRRHLMLAIGAIVLAAAFFVVFEAAKQVSAIAVVNPAANDPYDAVGSFAVQGALVLGALGTWRALRAGRRGVFDGDVAPVAASVALLVLVTLVSDSVALARYAHTWIGTPAGTVHAAALCGLGIGAAALLWAARRAAQSSRAVPARHVVTRAAVGVVASTLVLALYPQGAREPLVGALVTVVIGAVCLFVPTRLLLDALVPRVAAPLPADRRRLAPGLAWTLAVVAGLVAGSGLLLTEFLGQGGGSLPLGRTLMVIGVYLGLETIGVLLGYASLRDPLGLPGAPSS